MRWLLPLLLTMCAGPQQPAYPVTPFACIQPSDYTVTPGDQAQYQHRF